MKAGPSAWTWTTSYRPKAVQKAAETEAVIAASPFLSIVQTFLSLTPLQVSEAAESYSEPLT